MPGIDTSHKSTNHKFTAKENEYLRNYFKTKKIPDKKDMLTLANYLNARLSKVQVMHIDTRYYFLSYVELRDLDLELNWFLSQTLAHADFQILFRLKELEVKKGNFFLAI